MIYDMDFFHLRSGEATVIRELRNLNKAIGEIDEELKGRGKKLKGHKNLTNIAGIGDISATILLNTIGDINDFSGDHKLAAYIGIVPRVHISNKMELWGQNFGVRS